MPSPKVLAASALAAVTLAPAAAGAPAVDARVAAGSAGDARLVVQGLRSAVAAGRLARAEARGYRTIVRRTRAVLTLLPARRRSNLGAVLHEVAGQRRRFTRPRALALFAMLEKNADYLAVHPVPPAGTDVVDADGVVYRAGWSHGLQFHPLANFARLNAHVSAGNDAKAARLAGALVERAVARGRGRAWEYYFPFGGGWPPWTSGMAQAVAAQALARAGTRLEDVRLVRVARLAYRAIPPGLLQRLSAGPWVRLYSFSGLVVLNAQLQAVLSLSNYAELVADVRAAALAARLKRSSALMLPRFDTRYWSLYSLGRESPLKYHLYVIGLLKKLGARTGEPLWTRTATRFERYTKEPPRFALGKAVPVLYPWPTDGFRDEARLVFWVSKISTVTLHVGGERHVFSLTKGWHSYVWRPGARRPRVYRPFVSAVDLAGNRGAAALRPVVIEIDRAPPELKARVSGRRLFWRGVDKGTPWLRLTVRLRRGDARRALALGIRPLSGSLRLRLPRGRWRAILIASDSSGNRARAFLGPIPTPR